MKNKTCPKCGGLKMKVHAEIEFINKEGNHIHSDICPPDCDFDEIDEEYREIIHMMLDEWLNYSSGTGGFYIASENYRIEEK